MGTVTVGPRLAVPMNVDEFYDDDPRRRSSSEVTYGQDWHDDEGPGYLCALRWIEETREIYLMRKPYYPPVYSPELALSGGYPIGSGAIKIDVLGWADDQTALEHALEGWETHLADPDGVGWIRRRARRSRRRDLTQAAAGRASPSTASGVGTAVDALARRAATWACSFRAL